jgi:hypothetical protein
MSRDDSFDRVYKGSRRFFTSPQLQLGVTIVIGLFALLVTLRVVVSLKVCSPTERESCSVDNN